MIACRRHVALAWLAVAASGFLAGALAQRGGAPGLAPAAQQGRGRGGGRGQALAEGITIAGEVENYVPVTDAMLREPDPADWPMIRREMFSRLMLFGVRASPTSATSLRTSRSPPALASWRFRIAGRFRRSFSARRTTIG